MSDERASAEKATHESWPWLTRPDDEERVVRFTKAFHRCTDPKGNFGIGGVRMVWVLKVGDWAIGWDAFTDWGLPNEAFKAAAPACTHPLHQLGYPSAGGASGGAVDWHSPIPMYEDHPVAQEHCPVNGVKCYLDTGFILGSELFDLLRTDGDEAVWTRMRELLDNQRRDLSPNDGSRTP